MKRKIILASHGNLSNGMLDTAKMIIGNIPYEVETYFLVPGKLAEDYANELKIEIDANLDTEYIILTDLYGASVFTAMYALVERENVRLFSGMNLNLLLAVCVEYPDKLMDEDVDQIIKDAQRGLKHVSRVVEEEEDF